MNLPNLQGTCNYSDFFIYAACDATYFDQFAAAFINSIQHNTAYPIHLHLFNPRPDQLSFCQQRDVSVTWEEVPIHVFELAAKRWSSAPLTEPGKSRYERTVNAMGKGGDCTVTERLQKTYYACARFVRLSALYQNTAVLAMDIDAVIRANIPTPGLDQDFYLHHIAGSRARYLAGGLWLNGADSCGQFLNYYAEQLTGWFEQDYIYWGLDQDLLDLIVPKFCHGQLPISYIDWNMRPSSCVWTAKGTRKNLAVFVNEQKKYIV
jgi:hypothetical protein